MHESIINILKAKGFAEGAFSQTPFIAEFQNERIAITLLNDEIQVFVVMATGGTLRGSWSYSTNFEKNLNALITMTNSL